ncbi:hypothetical protein CS264_RS23540, partial [Vibrio parahaemolyticus]|nr:hypothetical protein [Vibrio parahaemolyticus]
MVIDDIINGLDVGGPKSYYSFETFIQHLFKHHIENQGKEFSIPNDKYSYGDAFAPMGFDSFDGPTLIEIKFNLSAMPIRHFLGKLAQRFLTEHQENSINTLLVVTAKPTSNKTMSRIKSEIEALQLPFDIVFWGPTELNRIVNKNKNVVKKITSNLFALRLSSAISKPSRDWKL